MKLYHTVKLVTEIDETKIPNRMLSVLKSLDEKTLNDVLAGTFVGACNDVKLLEQLNENNQYATLMWAE
jgi:hypothetical protein